MATDFWSCSQECKAKQSEYRNSRNAINMNPKHNGPEGPAYDFEDKTNPDNVCRVCGALLPWNVIANDDEQLCKEHQDYDHRTSPMPQMPKD